MLSPFVRRKLALGFFRFDRSQDGVVREDDLELFGQRVAENLGLAPGSPEYDRARQSLAGLWEAWFKPADKDGDGAVELDELIAISTQYWAEHDLQSVIEMNRGLFATFDFDGSGKVDFKEYYAFVEPMGVSEGDARAAFTRMDLDGDGTLSRDEFVRHWSEYWVSDDRSAGGNWFFGSF